MSGDVIVTVTLNAALHVAYTTGGPAAEGITPVSRPSYRAGGRGVTVARVLRAFGHDVLAAGLVGGASGEVIIQDLARSGVPTAFTLIRGESRRFFRFAGPEPDGPDLVVAEAGPADPDTGMLGAALIRLGAGAAAVAAGGLIHVVTAAGEWTARVEATDVAGTDPEHPPARGALVAGLVPGQLLGWSWPDRLRHALALAAGGAGAWTRAPGGAEDRDHMDLAAYERLLDAVRVEPP